MTVELRQLAHFIAVADHRGVGKAAEQLNLTQPALSKSVKRLEHALKVSLFERSPEGMTLTAYGKALYDRARHLVIEARHLVQEIDSLRGAHSGTVIVAAGPSMLNRLLPVAVSRLVQRRPNIRVVVAQGLVEEVQSAIARGEIDFAVGTLPENHLSKDLKSELLLHDEVTVIARRDHPVTRLRTIPLKRFAQFPWLLTEHQDALRRHLALRFEAAGVEPPAPRICSNSAEFMKACVATSDYLTYLPRRLIDFEAAIGLLVPVPVPELAWRRNIDVIRPAHRTLSPAAKGLIAELRAVVDETNAVGPRRQAQ